MYALWPNRVQTGAADGLAEGGAETQNEGLSTPTHGNIPNHTNRVMIQRTASAVVYVTAVAVLIGTTPYYLVHLGYVAPNEVSYSALLALLLVLAAFAWSFALLATLQLLRVTRAPMQALASILLSCLADF